jgi:NAD(P)-dependent dehydrogenase (short-subunit alcohol dehydrogenase family)
MILINSAGAMAEQPMLGHPDALWNHVIDVNLHGVYRTTKQCLPGMIQRQLGRNASFNLKKLVPLLCFYVVRRRSVSRCRILPYQQDHSGKDINILASPLCCLLPEQAREKGFKLSFLFWRRRA